jgi:hypothetical protein
VITIDFPGNRTRWVLPGLVGVVALGLIVALLHALSRRVPPVAPAPVSPLDTLARLDARYAGREAQTGAEEWAQYQQERARLKTEVTEQLAGKKPPA